MVPDTGREPEFRVRGADASEFSGSQVTGCSAIVGGGGYDGSFSNPVAVASSYPVTVGFNPLNPNGTSATMTVSDIANGGEGTATVSGYATTTAQTITFTQPATATSYTFSPGMTITIQATSTGALSGAPTRCSSPSIHRDRTGHHLHSCAEQRRLVGHSDRYPGLQYGHGNRANCQFLIDASQSGGLVNGVYYQTASGQSPAITINQATQTALPADYPLDVRVLSHPDGLAQRLVEHRSAGNFQSRCVEHRQRTISGSTLAVTQACNTATQPPRPSEIVIDAIQVGSADYLPAQAQQSIVVNQASRPSPSHRSQHRSTSSQHRRESRAASRFQSRQPAADRIIKSSSAWIQ